MKLISDTLSNSNETIQNVVCSGKYRILIIYAWDLSWIILICMIMHINIPIAIDYNYELPC